MTAQTGLAGGHGVAAASTDAGHRRDGSIVRQRPDATWKRLQTKGGTGILEVRVTEENLWENVVLKYVSRRNTKA